MTDMKSASEEDLEYDYQEERSQPTLVFEYPPTYQRRSHPSLESYLYGNATSKPKEDPKDHHAKLGKYASDLWKNNEQSDVQVRVEERVFSAHKTVLCCYSPYFKRHLAQTSRNSQQILTIRLANMCPDAFKVLLKYMYTGELNLTCHNIGDVYNAARQLEMEDAKNQCSEILSGKSRYPANILFIYVTCKKLNLEQPTKRILDIILDRFEEIFLTQDFLHLDVDSVVDIFSSDKIGARSEMVIYLAALKWLRENRKDHERYAVRLLSCIRFPLMNLDEILVSYYPPLMTHLTEIPEIRQMLVHATCFIAAKMAGLEGCFQIYGARPRKYLVQKDPLELWDISKYDESYRSPTQLDLAAKTIQKSYRKHLDRRRQSDLEKALNHAARTIQAFWKGQNVRKSYEKMMNCLSGAMGPKTLLDTMTTDPCLHLLLYHREFFETGDPVCRKHFPTQHLAKVDGPIQLPHAPVILLTGGINPLKPDDAVTIGSMMLRYDQESGDWERCGKMPFHRHHHCTALVRNYVYVIGGCDPRMTFKNRMMATSSCFRFDLKNKVWTQMNDMHYARLYHGVAVLHNIIYVVGGKDEFGRMLSSVECYAPEMDQWLELDQRLCCPRMGMGVAAYQDMIWIVGGMVQPTDENRIYLVKDVDCYDPHANNWSTSKSRIPVPRCFLTLAEDGTHLYAIGGVIRNDSKEDNLYLRSVADVQRYDYSENRWTNAGSLPSPRHSAAAAGHENLLCCVGGLSTNEMTPLSDMVVWDSHRQVWSSNSPLPTTVVGSSIIALPRSVK